MSSTACSRASPCSSRHALGFLRPHARQRLVEQQNLGIAGERHGDLELALLAVRERAGDALRERREADALEGAAAPSRRGADRSCRAEAMGARRELTACTASRTFSSTVRAAKMLVRWNERPTPSRVMRQAGSPATSRPSSSSGRRVGLISPGQHVDERGLAGAVRADDGMQLALMQRDGDVAHGDQAAEGAGKPCGRTGCRWGASAMSGAPPAVRRGAARPPFGAAQSRQSDAAQTLRQQEHDQQDDEAFHQQLALGSCSGATFAEAGEGECADDRPCSGQPAEQDHEQRLGGAMPADQLGVHEAAVQAHMWPATPASRPAITKAASL